MLKTEGKRSKIYLEITKLKFAEKLTWMVARTMMVMPRAKNGRRELRSEELAAEIPKPHPTMPMIYPAVWHTAWAEYHRSQLMGNSLKYLAIIIPLGIKVPHPIIFRTPWTCLCQHLPKILSIIILAALHIHGAQFKIVFLRVLREWCKASWSGSSIFLELMMLLSYLGCGGRRWSLPGARPRLPPYLQFCCPSQFW